MTGVKHVYSIASGTWQQVTMLACSSAIGQYLPPLLIFLYTRDPRFNVLEEFEEAFFQKTPNGWITEVVFLSFLRDIFIPKLGEKQPVVLLVDGHSSYHSVSALCNENSVILYCLKAHIIHLIQPLDLAFFRAIKLVWSEAIRKIQYQTGESVIMPKAKLQFLQCCSNHFPQLTSSGTTVLPACTPATSTSLPSASQAAEPKVSRPKQGTPTPSAFSNIFKFVPQSLPSTSKPTSQSLPSTFQSAPQSLPSTSQPAQQSLPSTSQPAQQSLPSTSQPTQQSLPSTSQSVPQSLPSTSQPGPQSLPSTSQPAQQSLLSTSQPAQQFLPSTSQPAPQSLPSTSQPAQQFLPSTFQLAPQSLPSTSQPAQQFLPSTFQFAPQSLPSTCQNSKTNDSYFTPPSFQNKKELKKTTAALPFSISGVEYRQMIEEKQKCVSGMDLSGKSQEDNEAMDNGNELKASSTIAQHAIAH
ncbi:uncharacterized protein LOC135100141 [Scylla paramamosain]|uniref:uncharacterized protein LOC135100141 n=1 Tax=Scylla paramamosain TaxID=85552 RepID=UPI003082B6B6